MAAPDLHPDIADLAPLLGTWRGSGRGFYPTIDPFEYEEVTTFGHGGKPFLVFEQRTRSVGDGTPMHTEFGYLRGSPTGKLEFVVTYPTGHVEVAEGSFDGETLVLRSLTVVGTATSKKVDALEREFTVQGDTLRYELGMAAVGEEMTGHLVAELHRASE